MIDPDRIDCLAYVTATAPAMGFDLPKQRLTEIADAFALVLRVGLPALQTDIPADVEPASVFVA